VVYVEENLKGVLATLEAWKQLPGVPLHIVGDGPCREQIEAEMKSGSVPSITYHGRLPRNETLAMMRNARFLIFPSEWYEGFPVTIAEAFACGVPVSHRDWEPWKKSSVMA